MKLFNKSNTGRREPIKSEDLNSRIRQYKETMTEVELAVQEAKEYVEGYDKQQTLSKWLKLALTSAGYEEDDGVFVNKAKDIAGYSTVTATVSYNMRKGIQLVVTADGEVKGTHTMHQGIEDTNLYYSLLAGTINHLVQHTLAGTDNVVMLLESFVLTRLNMGLIMNHLNEEIVYGFAKSDTRLEHLPLKGSVTVYSENPEVGNLTYLLKQDKETVLDVLEEQYMISQLVLLMIQRNDKFINTNGGN